jgi:hypothetical protein
MERISILILLLRLLLLESWMERISILILLLLESCLQTCMTYTIAECTVNNS